MYIEASDELEEMSSACRNILFIDQSSTGKNTCLSSLYRTSVQMKAIYHLLIIGGREIGGYTNHITYILHILYIYI